MGTMKVVLSDEAEQWIRDNAKYKGDISRIVEGAVRRVMKKNLSRDEICREVKL